MIKKNEQEKKIAEIEVKKEKELDKKLMKEYSEILKK